MSRAIREHIRSNVVGYVAIFMFAIGGTAYGLDGTNTVDSGDIINNEVRSADVRDDSLANGGLQAADLRPDSVGTSEVADDSLGSGDLAPDSVGSSEVAFKSLGSADLGVSSVGSSEVAPDSLGALDLAPDSVGASEVAAGTIGSAEIVDGGVANADLAANSVTGSNVFPSSLTGADILASSLTSSDIAADTLTAADIAASAVGSSEVANGSLGTAEFASSIPAVHVTRTISQGVSDGTLTTLNFNSERYDTAGMHSTSSNIARLTAPVTGIYEVSVNVVWSIFATDENVLQLRKNGSTFIATGTASNNNANSISTMVRLVAGDYVEALASQFSGSTRSIQRVPETSPEFSMTWLAPG
jgi:hypothetical protein